VDHSGLETTNGEGLGDVGARKGVFASLFDNGNGGKVTQKTA
jgi:hypothetical protein